MTAGLTVFWRSLSQPGHPGRRAFSPFPAIASSRFAAAVVISLRFFALRASARAFPPRCPSDWAALSLSRACMRSTHVPPLRSIHSLTRMLLPLGSSARLWARRAVEHDVYKLVHQPLRSVFSNNRQRSWFASRHPEHFTLIQSDALPER
jgi:hypothetical protein